MRPGRVPLSVLILLLSAVCAHAGGTPKDKSGPKKEPGKKTESPKVLEPAKSMEPPKSPLTIEGLKLSPGSVLVIVDELKEVLSLVPKMILIRPEKLVEMEERIKTLEKMLKQERRPASVCKLSGKLDGDALQLRAEFLFSTEQPRTLVFLGMQGAILREEGDLDGSVSHLEIVDDGYVVRVEKPGNHQLVLNLTVPVGLKRPSIGAGSPERSVELGLPGSTVTTLSLELPPSVKELRWNDTPEKRRGARWELALGKAKTLALTWREPTTLAGGGPFLTADIQVTGQVEETQILWTADLTLEDLRGQTKEWHLALPSGAKVDVKPPAGASYELKAIEGKPFTHVLELRNPGTERWVVQVQAFQEKPDTGVRLPMPPFVVFGSYKQQGTITIFGSSTESRGQRLLFHRFGEIHIKEAPRSPNMLGMFQFWSQPLGKSGKGLSRAPLELEWKQEKGKAEAEVSHEISIHPVAGGSRRLELATRFEFKKGAAGIETLDLQLPKSAPWMGMLGDLSAPFPSCIDWAGLARDGAARPVFRFLDAPVDSDGEALEWSPPDSLGRVRIRLGRPADKSMVVVIRGQVEVSASVNNVTMEVPRIVDGVPTHTIVHVKSTNDLELLQGRAGMEKPVAEIHRYTRKSTGSLDSINLFWRPYRPEIVARAIADVEVFHRTAHVSMHVQLDSSVRIPGENEVDHWDVLQHPRGVEKVRVFKGKKAGEALYEYDVDLSAESLDGDHALKLSFPWPDGATRKELKVRVWTTSGVKIRLNDTALSSRFWKERELERLEDRKSLPSLVLYSADAGDPELFASIRTQEKSLPPMIVDQGIIQVRIDEEGNQAYRALYLVSRIYARQIDVELPLPASSCLESVRLDGIELPREIDARSGNLVHLKVEPELHPRPAVLELTYRIPAVAQEGKRSWRSILQPPRWLGDVKTGSSVWQVKLPAAWVSMPFGKQVRQDYHWGFSGWLLAPLPSIPTDATTDTERELSSPGPPFSLIMTQPVHDSLVILHVAKPLWLLVCSSVVLIIGLVFLILSPSIGKQWSFALLVTGGIVALSWFWPALLPTFAHGCQPGLVALFLLVLMQWLLHQHYQRQIVFLPGFSRAKSGSSLSRDGSSLTREPSTVDAPSPSGLKRNSTNPHS